jgi:hypothetical protein
MTSGRTDRFHAATEPDEKAKIILEHLESPARMPSGSHSNREGWGGKTGQHWSNDQRVARGFSRPNPASQKQLREYGLPEDVSVVLHAKPPTEAQRYTPRGQHWRDADHPSEDEVTLKARAPVHLVGMTFPGHREYGKPATDKPGEYVPVNRRLRAGRYPEMGS